MVDTMQIIKPHKDKLHPLSENVFSALVGKWNLHRIISSYGSLYGSVQLSKRSDNILYYEEYGTLHLINGEKLSAERKYIYELSPKDGLLYIYYNDPWRQGDTLHCLEFARRGTRIVASHKHKCGDDVYAVTFEMITSESIEINYQVTGPKKNYTIQSMFTRHV
jgi:hypothetical protein